MQRALAWLFALTAAACGLCGVVASSAVYAAPASAEVDGQALSRFVDGYMQHTVGSGQTAGATVAIVRNGRLLTLRGYGMADVTRGTPVQGGTTQFRIGSITKVLVWIAVMQQVEAGRLDLEADVNSYLKNFQLPSDFTAPITLRHLMTHTPGLEDNVVDLFVSGPRQVGELEATLADNIPHRVRLPGSLTAYSNYGAALAAYLVTQASGMSWDDYVEAHVLQPLGMRDSTTRQPVPQHIDATRARGYLPSIGGVQEQGFTYVPLAPAGAGTATAADVAKLMAELLNPNGSRVLSAASKAQLLGDAFVIDAQINGMTLGLYEMSLAGGARAVGHDGNTVLFNSRMVLWPEHGVGAFVSTNTLGAETVAGALVELVAGRMGLDGPKQTLTDVLDGAKYAGQYLTARRNYSNHSKLLGLVDVALVEFDKASLSLVISDMRGPQRYRQLSDGVFQQVNGWRRAAFNVNPDGTRVLYFSDRPATAYTAADLSESPFFNLGLLLGWLVLALGVLLVWPVSSLTHRQRAAAVPGQRWLAMVCYAACLVVLYFMARLLGAAEHAYALIMQGFGVIAQMLWWPAVFAGLVLLQLFYGFRVWIEGFWWLSRRLHFTLLLFVQCAMVWWFWQWNLLPPVLLEYLK